LVSLASHLCPKIILYPAHSKAKHDQIRNS
jgi:hypothetical protein